MRRMKTQNDNPPVICATCDACCCRLEVMLLSEDDIPFKFTVQDQWGGWIMARLGDDRCAALDRNTLQCTIYPRRPEICREFQMGGGECIEERQRCGNGSV